MEDHQQPLRVNREISRRGLSTPSDQGIIEDSGEEEHDKKAARRSRSYIKTPMVLQDLGRPESSNSQTVSGLPDLGFDAGKQRPRSLPPPAPKRFSLPMAIPRSPFAEDAESISEHQKDTHVDQSHGEDQDEDVDREDESSVSDSQHSVPESRETLDQDSKRPPSEYDPYRFDQLDQAQAQSSPTARVDSLERNAERNESPDAVSHGGGVMKPQQRPSIVREVSEPETAELPAQERKAKKPEALNVTSPPTGKPTSKGNKPASSKTSEQHQEISPKYTPFPYTKLKHTEALVSSPTETSRAQRSPSPAQSPQSDNQRKYTDESSDVYETPPRSPEHTPSSTKGSEEKKARSADEFHDTESSFANSMHQKYHRPTKSDQSFGSKSERDFNDLVTGVETRKRTLTPKNLRDIEVCFFNCMLARRVECADRRITAGTKFSHYQARAYQGYASGIPQ